MGDLSRVANGDTGSLDYSSHIPLNYASTHPSDVSSLDLPAIYLGVPVPANSVFASDIAEKPCIVDTESSAFRVYGLGPEAQPLHSTYVLGLTHRSST